MLITGSRSGPPASLPFLQGRAAPLWPTDLPWGEQVPLPAVSRTSSMGTALKSVRSEPAAAPGHREVRGTGQRLHGSAPGQFRLHGPTLGTQSGDSSHPGSAVPGTDTTCVSQPRAACRDLVTRGGTGGAPLCVPFGCLVGLGPGEAGGTASRSRPACPGEKGERPAGRRPGWGGVKEARGSKTTLGRPGLPSAREVAPHGTAHCVSLQVSVEPLLALAPGVAYLRSPFHA